MTSQGQFFWGLASSALQSPRPSSTASKHVSGSENRGEAKCREEKLLSRAKNGNKNFFYCFLSVLVCFVFDSFMDCSRERTADETERERNGTGNSSRTAAKQAFLSLGREFSGFSTNENISIELVQWKRVAQKKAKKLVSTFSKLQHSQAHY